jgi:CBS domain-containing protein
MRAREVMSHPVVTVQMSTSIKAAAQLLVNRGFTAAPVLDDDNRLVGIITEADLIRGALPSDPRIQARWNLNWLPQGTVADVMSTLVESLTPGADVADAARMMVDERIRCLPIVDGVNVVGVITRRDVLRAALGGERKESAC